MTDSPDTAKPVPLWKQSVITMAILSGMLFAIEIIDAMTRFALDQYGIAPRTTSGLSGIVWAPLLHAGFGHLIANLIPGFILGFFLLLSRHFVAVTAIVWIVSGFGVWLTAPSGSITVGASGVIFGWFGYLLLRGFFNRDFWQVLGGLALLIVYGGMLWGVLPQAGSISWQGHLFGLAGGVLAAWWMRPDDEKPAPPADPFALDYGGLR